MALLTDDNAGLVQIAAAVFIVICAMLYYILPQNSSTCAVRFYNYTTKLGAQIQ
jgi:hypothetical protein